MGRVTPGRGLALELAGRAVDAGSVAWCCLPLLSSAGERGRLGHQHVTWPGGVCSTVNMCGFLEIRKRELSQQGRSLTS